jgi:hypothetical protein
MILMQLVAQASAACKEIERFKVRTMPAYVISLIQKNPLVKFGQIRAK